jgi:hypothetical protein
MRTGAINFQFDVSEVVARAMRAPPASNAATAFTLPFVTVLADRSPLERRIANELLIRLGDRRVLNSWECCDNCIDDALRSLQEIRSILLERRIELACEPTGILSHMIELMLTAIRQFLTFEQSLRSVGMAKTNPAEEFYRPHEDRQIYFDALEQLRGHLSRCLGQVAVVAGLNVPSDGFIAGYQGPWQMEAYKPVANASHR